MEKKQTKRSDCQNIAACVPILCGLSAVVMVGCATNYSKEVSDEVTRRAWPSSKAQSVPAASSKPDSTNSLSTKPTAADLSALDVTLAGLRQVDEALIRLEHGAKSLDRELMLPKGAIKDDKRRSAAFNLANAPLPREFQNIRAGALECFGITHPSGNWFIQMSTSTWIENRCTTNRALCAPTIAMLLSEATATTNVTAAMNAGKLAGRIANQHGLQLSQRGFIIAKFFEQPLTLPQSIAYLHALNEANDLNALSWVAQSHADDFVGKVAIEMLSGKRAATKAYMLQVRTTHQFLANGQNQLWDSLIRVANAQRAYVSEANGLIAAREAIKTMTGSLAKDREHFVKEIQAAEVRLAEKQRAIDDLTKKLSEAVAEAKKYKEQLEGSGPAT